MPSVRIVMSVVEAKRCPYYQVGDPLVLSDRAVELPLGAPACLILVRELTSLLFQLLPGGSRPHGEGPFTCGGCSGLIRFRRLPGDAPPASVPGDQAITGMLEAIAAAELLQVFHLHQKTGTLRIDLPDAPAEVVFHGGQLEIAQHGQLRGAEAIYSILRSKSGKFRFLPRPTTGQPAAVLGDFMAILMEGLKRMDEEPPDEEIPA